MSAEKTNKKKPRRAGQVVSRGDNKWLIRVYLGADPATGKRDYYNKTFHGTKTNAQKWLSKALTRHANGEPLEESAQSFGTWLDEWLKIKSRSIKPRTQEIYSDIVERILKPGLGKRALVKIAPADIQKLYAELEEKGWAGKTIQLVHAVLTNVFRQAARQKNVRENPMLAVDRPRSSKKEMQAFTADQVKAFLDAIEDAGHGSMFAFLFEIGCRPTEFHALKWADINWQAGKLTIQRNLVRPKRAGGKWAFSEPKTEKGRRTIPLSKSLADRLRQHRRAQNELRLLAGSEWRNNDLVFCNPFGEPYGDNYLRDVAKAALAKAELPADFRVYDARHTMASLLMMAGLSPKVVSERLGHANINITLEVYSHILPGMQDEATERLEKLIFG